MPKKGRVVGKPRRCPRESDVQLAVYRLLRLALDATDGDGLCGDVFDDAQRRSDSADFIRAYVTGEVDAWFADLKDAAEDLRLKLLLAGEPCP